METQVPAEGGAPSVPLEARLAAIEHRLDALEGSIRDTMNQELQAAGEEMRRAVSELGRLLLRDLDRLTKVLAEHRDAIVERLTSAADADAKPAGAPATGPAVEQPRAEPPERAEPALEAAPAPLTGEEGRWWVLPTRRRPRR